MPTTTWNAHPLTRLVRRLQFAMSPSQGERFLRLAAEARARVREVSPEGASRTIQEGALFLDVRERGEFARRHAIGAENLGKGTIEIEIERYAPDPATPIVCYCSGGNRSVLVVESLQRMGYTHVVSISGGLKAWIDAGFATASEKEFLD